MIIIQNRKKYQFKEKYTFDDFMNLVENDGIKFNFKNVIVIEKFKEIYQKMCENDGKITKLNFRTIIYNLYGIKNRNPYAKESLLERGFNESEINCFYKKVGAKHSNAIKNKLIECSNNNIYHYGKYTFKYSIIPKCKICGSNLYMRLCNNGDRRILYCENKECKSNEKNPKYSYIAFLPDDLIESIKKERREKNHLCIEYWLKKGLSENDAKDEISKIQSKNGKLVAGKNKIVDKQFVINKYGKDYAKNFFNKRSRFCVEYWLDKGFTESESKEKISKIQSEISQKYYSTISKEELKKKNCKCKEYWINKGFSEDDAKCFISQSQKTFSKEKCIKKYGLKRGTEIWKKRQEKWQESLSKSKFNQGFYSKVSQELFKEIENNYNEDDRDYLFYATKNKEFTLKNEKGFYYKYDFCDLKRRKFIEFNGDIYHGNPLLYEETDKPNPYHKDKTCKELWEQDENKKFKANENGFEEFVVWEKDYRNNPEETINKCLKFLLDE